MCLLLINIVISNFTFLNSYKLDFQARKAHEFGYVKTPLKHVNKICVRESFLVSTAHTKCDILPF